MGEGSGEAERGGGAEGPQQRAPLRREGVRASLTEVQTDLGKLK